ncbi:MAG: FtsX-like permease family protein [Pseudomonadota bacterium]
MQLKSYSELKSSGASLDHIFPESSERKKMTLVFACLSCLICLMMMTIASGLQAGTHWGKAFERNYVLELRSIPEISAADQLDAAMLVLQNDKNIARVNIVMGEELQDLMSPWLGDGLNIESLPISQLIEIEMKPGEVKKNLAALKSDLIRIPGTAIEAYHEAKAEYKAAGTTIRFISSISAIILIIIVATVTMASVESGVLDNKKIVSIMRLIGTENKLISRLFVRKILIHAIKGALIGMIGATALVALVSLVCVLDGLASTFIFSQFIPGIEAAFLVLCVPVTIVLVGVFSGKRTMNNMLKSFI